MNVEGYHTTRWYRFERCVPAKRFNDIKDNHFYGVFEDDFNKPPILQESTNESYFAPLRHQASINTNFQNDDIEKGHVDRTKQSIFFADYRVKIMKC